MADQQPGDKPVVGAREENPAPRAPDRTRIDGGASTVDAPARWSAAAAVPPPAPKNPRWMSRFDRFIRPAPVVDATQVDPDDWSAIPAVDPWAGQDTPLEAFPAAPAPAPAPAPPLPPTRIDAPAPPPPAPKPPAAGAAAAGRSPVPAAAGQRTGEPPSSTPDGRWGWLVGWILEQRAKQPQQAAANRLPVQPRPAPQPPAKPATPPPARPTAQPVSGRFTGRPAGPAGPVAPAANGRPVPEPRPWATPERGRPWTPPQPQRPGPAPRKRRRGRRATVLVLIGLVLVGGLAYYRYPAARQYPVSAELPKSFADLSQRNDSASRAAAERLAGQLQTAGSGATFAAVYGDGRGKRVTIFGVTGWRFNPGGDVRSELDRVGGEFGLGSTQTYDVGVPGVHESCGVGRSGGAAVVVCAWADHGSLATVLLTRRSLDDSADLVARLRGAVLVPAV